MAETLLTPEETQVYIMNRFEQITDIDEIAKQLGHSDSRRVQEILNSIDDKAKIAASPNVLHNLVSKYRRILEIAKEYYLEKTAGVQHVFSIDFSDLYVYLNPREAFSGVNSKLVWDQINVGSIYYMFDSKRKEHEYYLLPPAAWELLNHIYEKYQEVKNTDFDKFVKSPKGNAIKKFYQSITNVDENKYSVLVEQLINSYEGTGGLVDILNMAQKDTLTDRFAHTISTIKEMSDGPNKKIKPINADDAKHVEVDEKVYKYALSSLSYYRPRRSISNKVDALNLAITYNLTSKDKDAFYRLVSHSKQPSKAFRLAEYNRKWISCCPQCVSTLILFEDKFEKTTENGKDIINFQGYSIDENIERLKRIGHDCIDLQHMRRFTMYPYLNEYFGKEKLFIEKVYEPVQKHYSDLVKFKQQIYTPLIQPIMDINAGKGVNRKNCFKEDVEFLENLLDRRTYETMAQQAYGIILNNVKETRKFLADYVNENHTFLKPEMQELFKKIDTETA
jgi:hypothetical protein